MSANGIPFSYVAVDQSFVTPDHAAVAVAQFVARHGSAARSRGLPSVECLWTDFTIQQPECIPFDIQNRKLNPRYAALEIASLLAGTPVDAHQRETARGMAKFQDGGVQRGNYGVRIRNQLRDFVVKLIDDPGTRQAVMSIWNDRDLIDDSKDVPCTLNIQGVIRDEMFYMRTTMRSNDVFLGLPYDLMQFCALQTTIAEILDIPAGFYRHSVGSMHCYTQDIDRVNEMMLSTDEHEGDNLWHFDGVTDELERLAVVQQFCQSALYGFAMTPETDFEHWLLESL